MAFQQDSKTKDRVTMIGLEKLKSKEKKLNYLEVKYFSIQKKERENEVKETGFRKLGRIERNHDFFYFFLFFLENSTSLLNLNFFFKFKAITNLSKNM